MEYKKKFRVSTVHAAYLGAPEEANPESECFSGDSAKKYVYDNIGYTAEWIRKAGEGGADLVCTNEDFAAAGTYGRDVTHPCLFAEIVAETAPVIERMASEAAKRYGMYIAANYYRYEGRTMYNASTLFGRNGETIGVYRKVHPADGERWLVSPGDGFPVFETDLGRIGMSICYDMIFPETFRCLALNGADIILLQTQGWGTGGCSGAAVGEGIMRARAAENCVYFIVAKNVQNDGGKSLILDNSGNSIAEAQGGGDRLLTADIEPDFDMTDIYHYDNYFGDVPGTRARMMLARRPAAYGAIVGGKPALMDRYDGLSLCETYARAEPILNRLRNMDDALKSKYHW